MEINCGGSSQVSGLLTHDTRCIHPSTPLSIRGWRQSVAVRKCITVINKVDLPASRNLVHSAMHYATACVN